MENMVREIGKTKLSRQWQAAWTSLGAGLVRSLRAWSMGLHGGVFFFFFEFASREN